MQTVDRYVVIGNPVAHSKSPEIHAQFAAATEQSITYQRLPAALDSFVATVHQFIAAGGRGANVTVPFKQQACQLATRLTERAAVAAAVNTLTFDGTEIIGDNTDGAGLVTDLISNAGIPLQGRRILLLGAGGAARGVLQPLLLQNPARLVLANRTATRAQDLVHDFAAYPALEFAELDQLVGSFDLIINATSASLQQQLPALPTTVFGTGTFAYDMMYGAQPTVFMQFAAEHGARVRDGLGMLVEQAAEAFFVWRGVRPQTASVYRCLRAQLSPQLPTQPPVQKA
ncbi:MAG: shikimate dehydrogenase [Herbaspirillum sp.]